MVVCVCFDKLTVEQAGIQKWRRMIMDINFDNRKDDIFYFHFTNCQADQFCECAINMLNAIEARKSPIPKRARQNHPWVMLMKKYSLLNHKEVLPQQIDVPLCIKCCLTKD